MSARALLRLAGLLVSAVAVIWIGIRFARSGALDLLASAPLSAGALIAVLALAATAYALAMALPGIAWWRLTAALSSKAPPARPIIATYAVTQFGKYLPGNVAHYALRHAWSRRHGLPHAGLGLASVLEAMLLLLASLGLTLLGDTRPLRVLSMLDPRVAIALLVAMLLALGVALWLARRRELAERWHIPALPPVPALLVCLACYVAFFVACAGILDALAHALGVGIDSFAMLLAASAASWAAGFIVIGAPGGLGVREAAFVALAGAALGETRALLLIGVFRIATFLGDALFLAAGALALRGTRAPSGDEDDPGQHRRPT
jgi:glycosyltransferase 2 family protein